MEDPLLISVVRLEEGMVRLHDRLTSNHKEFVAFMNRVESALIKNDETTLKVIKMEVSHKWLYTIATVITPCSVTALELYLHYFKGG